MRLFGVGKVANRDLNEGGILFGLRASGEEFPMEVSISHLETNGQRLFTVVVRDVTERYRSDEALRKSEQRLRLAIQAGRMYADEWDAASDTIVRSPEYVDILGKDQPMQTTCRELLNQIHPDDRDQVAAKFARITPENPFSTICYRFLRSDGTSDLAGEERKGIL